MRNLALAILRGTWTLALHYSIKLQTVDEALDALDDLIDNIESER